MRNDFNYWGKGLLLLFDNNNYNNNNNNYYYYYYYYYPYLLDISTEPGDDGLQLFDGTDKRNHNLRRH